MYYITSSEYVGPNQATAYGQAYETTYYIQTVPGRTNMSNEPRTMGWLGTTSDWEEYAHGEFEALDEARAALSDLLPDGYRDCDDINRTVYNADTAEFERVIVEAYYAGRLQPWSAEQSTNWAQGWLDDITADTTDDEINSMVDDAVAQADTDEGGKLDDEAVRGMLTNERDELKLERDDD